MTVAGRRRVLEIGGVAVEPTMWRTVDLPGSVLSNHTTTSLPVHGMHGRRRGRVMFVSAAAHGAPETAPLLDEDEIL